MDNLRKWAQLCPEKPAAILYESGEAITYAGLDAQSARIAAYLVSEGLEAGAPVAVLIGNSLRYFEVCWGARRAGLYYVAISTHLKPSEIQYILEDSQAQFLFVSKEYVPMLLQMSQELLDQFEILVVNETGGEITGVLGVVIKGEGAAPELPVRPEGKDFPYSSGTTGRPKGIRQTLQPLAKETKAVNDWVSFFNFNQSMVYLSPAPLYHAAPLRYTLRCQDYGGTVVLMEKFDALGCLNAIAKYRVTHSQWVPTMFVRLLALPEDVRRAADVSSMQRVVHAAAPCPQDVKLRMLEWWGPIIWEYYGGSERNGATVISPQEWLTHRGSVGRAVLGELHIVAENGHECAAGVEGQVYFGNGPRFEYHNDPVKTASAYNAQGWSTIGDIGFVDAEGYLHLTDRRANMIISGGVNVYPQEAENLLLTHPAVEDVAVVGVPHPEFGEEVKAVVQLRPHITASAELARELIEFCREQLSHIKCPRSVDFEHSLPRTEGGKLLKRVIRDSYRGKT